MIQIEVTRVDGEFHMVGRNQEGNEIHIDASSTIGGTGKGMRPMQLLLTSLAGCSAIDVISILKKQKQTVLGIKTIVQGEREERAVPSPFKSINLHFILFGSIALEKVEKAVALSVDKYCSVAATLDKNVRISYSCAVQKSN